MSRGPRTEKAAPDYPEESLWVGLLGRLWALLLRLNGLTWRKELIGVKDLDGKLARGERVLFCFWHGKYLPLLFLLRGRKGCVFSSLSLRGGVIASMCHRFGYDCVKIPEVERSRTLQCLGDAMEKYQACGIAIDGPRGPFHVVKRRPIQMASSFGFVILPTSMASRRSLVFRFRWDQLELPYPFTKVCLVVGEAIRLPPALSSREALAKMHEIRKALEEAEARARKSVVR